MFVGIAFALAACFIWGLIFVVPSYMKGFSSMEVVLGRYFFYGVISSLIFFKSKLQGSCKYPLNIWKKAAVFSFVYTMGYYIFVVLALGYSSPAICALILGISPIAIAFYGNFRQREVSFKSLILPSLVILCGLIIINIPHLLASAAPSSYFLGLLCSFFALAAWSWYVVANSRFLKSHPQVHSGDWSTLIGVTCLFWVFLFALVLGLFFKNHFGIEKFLTFTPELKTFLIGSIILGVLCAWVGAFLWNKASLRLPVSLAGQLTIFETIFGVIFVYVLQRHMPTLLESIGIGMLLFAVVYGVRQFAKSNSEATPL